MIAGNDFRNTTTAVVHGFVIKAEALSIDLCEGEPEPPEAEVVTVRNGSIVLKNSEIGVRQKSGSLARTSCCRSHYHVVEATGAVKGNNAQTYAP